MLSCATDEERLRPGLGALLESLIGRLAVQTTMRPMVVVEVFPFLELVVEHLGVVDNDPLEEPVELLGVDAMGALDFAVESRGAWLDVDMAGAFVQHMPVEAGGELGPIVGLDDLDPEREALQHVVQELDGRLLVELGIDAQHAQAGGGIDGGELVGFFWLWGTPGGGGENHL